MQLRQSGAARQKRYFIACSCEAPGVKAAEHARADDEDSHPNTQSFGAT